MAVSFERHMLGTNSQDMVLRLQESEIKLLELIRDCIQARVQGDKEYARLLSASCIKAQRYDPVVRTPLNEVWKNLINKTEMLSAMVKKQADLILSSTVEKLQVLIADKRAAKQMFMDERAHFEAEINKAKAEINRNYGEYTKAMVKVKAKRGEYDDLLAKGKSGKLDDLKRKYNVLTDKLHKIHNDYVISMSEGSELQEGLLTSILPMYMAAQESYCQDSIVQCKSILMEYTQTSDTCNHESARIHSDMKEIIATTNAKKEYTTFIEQYQTEAQLEQLKFDVRVLDGYNGILQADEISVDDTTYEVLDQLRNTYKEEIRNREPDIASYQEQVNSVKSEISSLAPHTTAKSEVVPKRRHQKWLERKLKEATLYKNRQQKILDLISVRLSQSDPKNLPKASSLDSSFNEQQNGLVPTPSPRGVSYAANDTGIKSKFTKMFKQKPSGTDLSALDTPSHRPGKRPSYREEYCVVIPGDSRPIKMTDNPESPLEDEEWFHGILPREEVQRLLKQDGDYLVRESKKRNESQYVLSVMWQGPKHFIVQRGDGGWRFEGRGYPTIQELIIQQHKSNSAVTNKSQAILTTPVMRETWQIKNDDIKLEDKIGNGNFGEVFKGIYKGGVVAVKTCKEELQEEQKKKFILEGRILRRYDHPNIVKFVGIAAQKNPVMIVMEFVSGGALLSWLRKNGLAEPKRNLIQMCIDAGSGMAYLESKSVIHRDLAARNCLVSESKVVKISDFGMSREEETYEVTQGMRQIPIKWTAPEALNYGKYTSLCDVWSFGILMWEIFSAGKTPYTGMRNQEARDKVDAGYRMACPEGCPNGVYSLMRDCWEERAERRPHFDRIVKELTDSVH